jgi:hypothetical protein
MVTRPSRRYRRDAREIAIEQVDRATADPQPAAAIDPRPPAAERRHGCSRAAIVERRRRAGECGHVETRAAVVIKPDVVVGIWMPLTARPRSAERDGAQALYAGQRSDDVV